MVKKTAPPIPWRTFSTLPITVIRKAASCSATFTIKLMMMWCESKISTLPVAPAVVTGSHFRWPSIGQGSPALELFIILTLAPYNQPMSASVYKNLPRQRKKDTPRSNLFIFNYDKQKKSRNIKKKNKKKSRKNKKKIRKKSRKIKIKK